MYWKSCQRAENWISEILYVSTDAAAASHHFYHVSRSPPSAMEPSGSWSEKRNPKVYQVDFRNHQEYEEYKEHERFVTNLMSIALKNV